MESKLTLMMLFLHRQLPCTKSYLNTFSSIISDRNRFKYVYQQLKTHHLFPAFIRDRKSDPKSLEHRRQGVEDHLGARYLDAVVHYTQALSCAESEATAALAYVNRSSSLFMLGMYKECVQDIDRAFDLDFPQLLLGRLAERRKHALRLQNSGEDYHEPVPQVSDTAVDVLENPELGRHAVAARDLHVGEVVAVEPPLACVLLRDHLLHCHHCLKLCYNLIPCPSCTQALFCSEGCLNTGRTGYHKYECPVLLTFAGCDTILMALRFLTLNEGKIDKNWLKMRTGKEHLEVEEVHYVTATAAVMFHLLKAQTQLLGEDLVAPFQDSIVAMMLAVKWNGCLVSEYRRKAEGEYEQHCFATAIYPSIALFGHSCCENVSRYYFGSTVVLKVVHTVRKGDQLFLNYGFPYDVYAKEQRQEGLEKRYHLKCTCRACVEDWKPHLVQFLHPSSAGLTVKNMFLSADVAAAKRWLPYLIPLLEQCEQWEPLGNALTLRKMICNCFEALANKRRL